MGLPESMRSTILGGTDLLQFVVRACVCAFVHLCKQGTGRRLREDLTVYLASACLKRTVFPAYCSGTSCALSSYAEIIY